MIDYGDSILGKNGCCIVATPSLKIGNYFIYDTYSPSCNLAPPISQVVIGQHLIFCSLTSPTCCNSPRKCTPVKYNKSQSWVFNCHIENLDIMLYIR